MPTHCERKQNLSNAEECENDFSLILKAAEQGDASAQCELGLMYCFGEDVEQNLLYAVNPRCFPVCGQPARHRIRLRRFFRGCR